MTSMYICRSCRESLLRYRRPQRGPQWQARAGFLSLLRRKPKPSLEQPPASTPSSQSSPEDPVPLEHEAPSHYGASKQEQRSKDGQAPEPTMKTLPSIAALFLGRPPGRYSKNADRVSSPTSTDAPGNTQITDTRSSFIKSEARYPTGVSFPSSTMQNELSTTLDNGQQKPTPRSEGVEQHASRLMELIHDQSDSSTVGSWTYFLEHFGTEKKMRLIRPAFQEIPILVGGGVFKNLLDKMVRSWCDLEDPELIASPLSVIAKLEEIKAIKPDYYTETLWILITKTLKYIASNDPKKVRIMQETMKIWEHFFSKFGKHTNPTPDHKWSTLPGLKTLESTFSRSSFSNHNKYTMSNLSDRLLFLAPSFTHSRDIKFRTVVLISFNLLTKFHEGLMSAAEYDENVPFINAMASAVFQANYQNVQGWVNENLPNLIEDPEFAKNYLDQFQTLPQQAISVIASRKISKKGKDGTSPLLLRSDAAEEFLLKRLGRATETQDLRRIDSLWSEAKQTFSFQVASIHGKIPIKVYDAFLTSYMAMRNPDRTVEVWNHIIENGIMPTVTTWTAMLMGCNRAHDINALEKVWQRMIEARVQPDTHAWTVRIHCLISHGRRQQGLQALEDMGQIWTRVNQAPKSKGKKKSEGNSDNTAINVAKPGVETVNAVLTALSRKNNDTDIAKVLNWAKTYDIEPDTGTFNVLIRMAFRRGKVEEAFKILENMEALKIKPDVATYTIVVDAMFGQESAMEHLSDEEKNERVMEILKEIESRGLQINAWVCSTLIDGLLKYQGNISAAQSVLRYMAAHNINPTPHVYTMLVTHFFDQDPPNIAAVDALCSHTTQAGAVTDLIFFDRVIEGYARFGEIGKMMTALARMSREGKRPGWPALIAVTEALARAGDFERLRAVVRDVRNSQGVIKTGIRDSGRPGRTNFQERFWVLVKDLGLDDIQNSTTASNSPISKVLA